MTAPYLTSPYIQADDAFWLKGNCHTHTTRSDGRDAPQRMIDRYAELGHDFLMLSDHDVLADYTGVDARGLLLLPGVELSHGQHILDIGARTLIGAKGDGQAMIDEVNRDGGLPILCHPNWEENFNHYPYEDMLRLNNYAGVEIFNGIVIDLAGNHLSTDKWDRLLTAGRQVWGFAHDDAHALKHTGRGCNVVLVREKTAAAVIDALRAGSFYASSGVVIESISVSGSTIRLRSPNADRIAVFGQYGARLAIVDGPEIAFDAAEVSSPYIRIECYGRGGDTAWTQPFAIHDGPFQKLQERLAELGATAKSQLRVHRSDRAPNLTGNIDDPLWQQAGAHGRFMTLGDGHEPPVKTEIRCILAQRTLFFAVKCEEPLLEEMKLTAQADGETNLWSNDSVELFVDVDGRAEGYYHLMVTAAGFSCAVPRGNARQRQPRVSAKAGRWAAGGTTGWSAEVALPLDPLGTSADAGGTMGFHVCRNRFAKEGYFVWSWAGTGNHNPAEYGSLLL